MADFGEIVLESSNLTLPTIAMSAIDWMRLYECIKLEETTQEDNMADLNQEIQEIIEIIAQARVLQADSQGMINRLRKRIKSGKTTGDGIKDFVISCYGLFPIDEVKKIETVYRDLQASMSQHVGELVLIIAREEVFHGCTGFGCRPRDLDYSIEERLYLGALNDGALVLDFVNGKCELPTGNHALCGNVWREDVKLVEENLASPWLQDFGFNLNKPLECRDAMGRVIGYRADFKLEVKVGDAEVYEWFRQKGEQDKHYLVVFHKMAQFLGRPMIENPDLTAEFLRRREALTKRLIELIHERDQLQREIAGIFGAMKRGVYSSDGISWTVCETEDDARVISMGPRQKLKEVESEITRLLGVALELGMIDHILISVRKLCQEYGIDIP